MKSVKQIIYAISIIIITLLFTSCNKKVKDIDGNIYGTVQIGNQIWLTKNLNVSHFSDGDPIIEAKSIDEWDKAGREGMPAWCYFNNDPANGDTYGKLYNWFAVNDSRGLCPEDWRLPRDKDLTKLTDYLGGEEAAGIKLKSTIGWEYNGNGNNESGFTALPGGFRHSNGDFGYIGHYGFWWSASLFSTSEAWYRGMGYNFNTVYRIPSTKEFGFSVRCLMNVGN